MAAPPTTAPPRSFDRARFYTIEGQQWPSVTTVLDIIAKPALGPWYAKEERRHFEAAMLEVLGKPGARDPEYVLTAVAEAVSGVKAADRAKQQAASIGTTSRSPTTLRSTSIEERTRGIPECQFAVSRRLKCYRAGIVAPLAMLLCRPYGDSHRECASEAGVRAGDLRAVPAGAAPGQGADLG